MTCELWSKSTDGTCIADGTQGCAAAASLTFSLNDGMALSCYEGTISPTALTLCFWRREWRRLSYGGLDERGCIFSTRKNPVNSFLCAEFFELDHWDKKNVSRDRHLIHKCLNKNNSSTSVKFWRWGTTNKDCWHGALGENKTVMAASKSQRWLKMGWQPRDNRCQVRVPFAKRLRAKFSRATLHVVTKQASHVMLSRWGRIVR